MVEKRPMGHPKVRQAVVVDRHATAHPAVGIVLLAQPLQGTCTAYPLQGRIQPQRHQDGRVNRRASRPTLQRPNPLVQGREIYPCHKGPDGAYRMILGDERFQMTGPQLDLSTVGPLVARRCTLRHSFSTLSRRRHRRLLFVKQWDVHFAPPPSGGQINGETLHQCRQLGGFFHRL
jgi:hypothetical protein